MIIVVQLGLGLKKLWRALRAVHQKTCDICSGFVKMRFDAVRNQQYFVSKRAECLEQEIKLHKVTCNGTLRNAMQHSTVQHSTVQYSTVQYSTVQYSTVQFSSVQHSTAHIYTQTIHRTTQQFVGQCGPCPVLASYTLSYNLSQGSRV